MSARTRARRRHPVEIPSAGSTIVSLVLSSAEPGGPWPLTRVLTALGSDGVDRVGLARAVGDRHAVPLVHQQELRWREQAVFVEARHGRDGLDELSLELPAWDELAARGHEEAAWSLVDAVALASDGRFGSIGDGEPPETALPDGAVALRAQLRRHLALLLPDWMADEVLEAGAAITRSLDGSGLLVVVA